MNLVYNYNMNFVCLAVFCALTLHSCALANVPVEPAASEPCPEDSVAIEGVCKCDHNLCDKPPCATLLTVATNSTNIPGFCCPTYSCEGCTKEEEIEGKCPCLPGATIRSGRKCECVDPHKSLTNNTCVCDENKCELPDLCDERSVPVQDIEGCCLKVKCVPCPEDSYPTEYTDHSVEDKCVCYPCPPTKCNETQRPEILRRGKTVPGMCCDIYNCENVDPNKGCVVNGETYSEGKTWYAGDEKCKCQNGISFCSPMSDTDVDVFRPCLMAGNLYKHQETWMMDACTNCTCKDGDPKCIAHMCDISTSEVKKPIPVCPPLYGCKKICENGFKLNKQGCETCKCKPSDKAVVVKDKYTQLDAMLKERNLTETDVINLVKNFVIDEEEPANIAESSTTSTTSTTTSTTAAPTTTSTSTPAPSTTIFITDGKNSHGDCAYSCILEFAVPGFAVGAIFGAILLFSVLKCSEKNRQKYKMAYNYKPVGKDAVDKNLNFSPIIKSKNFELQSYNEKKNVI